ncbi:uncharacterized protein DUF955 [Ureibacillus xyleni]|uniref:Uncharacterized protein DUF955 n=1 Tax=Ureibacillus xyleni TaxID=614648 RepID=A0A285TLV7_9BACL|nr:ImmA/IrrE family metallo-endopeptidase [Ureibacillus xyleni]SOC21729.1 uncharacterized protein DUF955 [Ureibacillus xyleni]
MDRRQQAETIAEAFASSFLEDEIGHDLFIGPHIERLLADKVHIIYQFVEDEAYFGAAITHQNGEQFVALNTFHSLRMRYFTAAHELWHLSEGSQIQETEFDHERAADRFAAAIMLPKSLTRELWEKFKKRYGEEEAVFYIADLAAVPYVAVVRRLNELGEKVPGLKSQEIDWLNKRSDLGLTDSILDQANPDIRFTAYKNVVKANVEHNGLDRLKAANKLAKFAPKQAEKYQQDALVMKEPKDEA